MSKTKSSKEITVGIGTVLYVHEFSNIFKTTIVKETPKFWVDSMENKYYKEKHRNDGSLEPYGPGAYGFFETPELKKVFDEREAQREARDIKRRKDRDLKEYLESLTLPTFEVDGVFYSTVNFWQESKMVRVDQGEVTIEYEGNIRNPQKQSEWIHSERHPSVTIIFPADGSEPEVTAKRLVGDYQNVAPHHIIAQLEHSKQVMENVIKQISFLNNKVKDGRKYF